MTKAELQAFLNEKARSYESPEFIADDPIQIPHGFTKKEDIEISAFLVATIAWGNRKSIIVNGKQLIDRMGNCPHEFVLHHTEEDLKSLDGFVHRTFNAIDARYFIKALHYI